jgi:hypothetical protein
MLLNFKATSMSRHFYNTNCSNNGGMLATSGRRAPWLRGAGVEAEIGINCALGHEQHVPLKTPYWPKVVVVISIQAHWLRVGGPTMGAETSMETKVSVGCIS